MSNSKRKLWIVVGVVALLVCVPFAVVGEDYAAPLLERRTHAGWLFATGAGLLAADSVAPVPSSLVVMIVAANAGWIVGTLTGFVGMTAGVFFAAGVGRVGGRAVPKWLPASEMERLRSALQNRLLVTLACLRSIPVAAETSVIVAAALQIPIRRIVAATLLPNLLVSLVFALAGEESLATAAGAFLATAGASALVWLVVRRRVKPGGEQPSAVHAPVDTEVADRVR